MKSLLCLLFMLSLFIASISPIHAHPLDEIGGINVYDQKQTLEISPNETILKIDLKFYASEKIRVWESIDTNRDQELSEAEKTNWMQKGIQASWLETEGQNFPFKSSMLVIPSYYDFFDPPPADVEILYKSDITLSPEKTLVYHYKGKDKGLNESDFKAIGQNGISVAKIDPINSETVSLSLEKGNQSGPKEMGLKTGDRINRFLNKYVKNGDITPSVFATAIFFAFVIGMLHALTPGHGKAIVAGYLVGEKGTAWHAIQLGLIITITHTSSVFLLGLGTLFLAQYIVPETIIKGLNLVSGILVTFFGTYLFLARLKKLQKHVLSLEEIEAHEIMHAHDHEHNHTHSHSHAHHGELELTWKNLVPLGVSGGIVPCVDALAILIVAASLGKILWGMILLMAFSLGLAAALIAGGISVILAKNKAIKKIGSISKYEKFISLGSAVVVIILGLAIIMGKTI